MALKSDGTMWMWGDNNAFQSGDGISSFADHLVATQVMKQVTPIAIPLTGVTSVAAGNTHTVALLQDGTVWAWGSNWAGQLGNNDSAVGTSKLPVQVTDLSDGTGYLTDIIAISAGDNHTLALKQDRTVFGWGYRGGVQQGAASDHFTAVNISGLSNITAISANSSHNIALDQGGNTWTWGADFNGQLGNAACSSTCTTPASVLAGVAAISAGPNYTMTLMQDGTMKIWGGNWSGQLGDSTTTSQHLPVTVANAANVIAIDSSSVGYAAGAHSTAVLLDGTIIAWGLNTSGELGIGNTNSPKTTPVQVVADASGIPFLLFSTHTVTPTSRR